MNDLHLHAYLTSQLLPSCMPIRSPITTHQKLRGDHNGDNMVTMLQLAAAALLFSQLLVVYGASDEKEQEVAAVLRRMVRSKCYI